MPEARGPMLKKRVIACLLLNGGVLTRTKRFVADYGYTAEFVGNAAVDEVFIINVTRGEPERAAFEAAAERYIRECFVPVSMGGWVSSLDDCKRLFDIGADKIVIGRGGRSAFLVQSAAIKYGSQAVVAGVDAHAWPGADLAAVASALETQGVGEIFLQSVERDGSLGGYDLDLLRRLKVGVPVVIGGGIGNWTHMRAAFEAGADGCATSNIFHMTENGIGGFKRELRGAGIEVRP